MEEVSKVYPGDVVAVREMNLGVRDGEFVVFVGPSGCGKSTALRMIAGLEDVSSGRVFIGDDVVNGLPPRARDVAMVFQNYALYPHMNVRENMGFALRLRKMDPGEIHRRVEEAARMLSIERYLDRKPKALSGGQRQRVALGRALVREPKVFLMDEPLSNLDAKLRVQMRTEIGKLHDRSGVTTIYVTHDQTEAMTMADRIVVLKDGVVQQVDAPQTMYERPKNVFVAGFIGSPAMNFVRARIEKDGSASGYAASFGNTRIPLDRDSVGGRGSSLGAYIGGEAVLGIRPEHIEDATLTGDAAMGATANPSTIEVRPELIESVGSEKYVYFSLPTEQTVRFGSVAAATGEVDEPMVARVSAGSGARRGERMLLALDASKVKLFDPETEEAIL